MKVLMATDGSQFATTALKTACRMLHKGTHEVCVLCVAPEFYQASGAAEREKLRRAREEYRRQIAEETQRIIEDARRALSEEGVAAETRVEIGSPAGVIVRTAANFDVTVIGALGRYEHTKFGLGPVASRVIEASPGALLIARETVPIKGLRILVAVDASLACERALQLIPTLLNLDGAEITLLHVVETPWIHIGLDREWFPATQNWDETENEVGYENDVRLEAEDLVEHARRRLERFQASLTTMIVEGLAGTAVLGEAEQGEYDLVVLGATGVSDFRHSVLGSVSSKVAWSAPCSVLVVKETE